MALIAAGSAACGSAQATPQGKVENAFVKLGDQKSLTMGLSFGASADQIYSVMKGEDDFTKSTAEMLAGLHADVTVSADKPLADLTADDKDTSAGIRLSVDPTGKRDLFEVRQIGGTTYLRADIKELEKLADSASAADGSDSGDIQELKSLLDGADKLPDSLGSVKAALAGDWISVNPKSFESLAGALGGTAPTPPKLDSKTQAQLLATLKGAFAHNVTYKDLGSKDGADHIQVSVPAQQLAKELKTGLAPALKSIPGFDASTLDGLDDVPNKTVSADLAIKGGMVSAVSVDIAQFDKEPHTGKLPLVLSLKGGGPAVTAPAGAKELKPQDLMGLFMSALPGAGDDAPLDDSSLGDLGLDPSDLDLTGLDKMLGSGTDGGDTTDTGFFSFTPQGG